MQDREQPNLDDVIRGLPGAAIVLSRGGVVVALNDSFLDEFAAEDAYGETIAGARLDQLADSLDATVLEPLKNALDCERLALHGVMLWKHGAKHGERFDVVISRVGKDHSLVTFVANADDAGALGERRRLERLACLGMAASGVAHDLNNHLAAAMNVATLLADELAPDSPHQGALDIIVRSSQEAADLARKLLAFAGRGQPEIERLDLKKLVEEVALLIRHELPRDGRIQFEFRADDTDLRGDATQIEHSVLLLLLRLARQLDPAATARVSSRRMEFTTPDTSTFGRRIRAGSYVALEFSCPAPPGPDGGNAPSGADPATGAVLNDELLATVDAIASEHGGALIVAREDRDDVARMLLALSRQPASSAPQPRESTPAGAASRTILVADDDDMVRDVAVAMIRRLGHVPLVAAGGREAIEIVKRGSPAIDLVILDLVMTDLDGATVLREIRRIAPAVKVIVSSGYGVHGTLATGTPTDGTLEKPYTLAALKNTLGRVFGLL